MSIWFAIHVKPGCEVKAVELLNTSAATAELEELFTPISVIGHREHGETVEREVPFIPGCVVAVAPSKWELRRCLRRADGMSALYDGDVSFDILRDEEAAFINLFTEPGNRVVSMSEGVVSNGRVTVRSGPLAGREQMVRRYSDRRRRAVLDASVAGVPAEAQVGLRVVRDEAHIDSRFSRRGVSR